MDDDDDECDIDFSADDDYKRLIVSRRFKDSNIKRIRHPIIRINHDTN